MAEQLCTVLVEFRTTQDNWNHVPQGVHRCTNSGQSSAVGSSCSFTSSNPAVENMTTNLTQWVEHSGPIASQVQVEEGEMKTLGG